MNEVDSTIERVICRAAAEQGGFAVEKVSPATHFTNDLDFDSLDAMEFTMSVEDALGVKIPDEKVPEMTTVQMVIDYVTEQKRHAPLSLGEAG